MTDRTAPSAGPEDQGSALIIALLVVFLVSVMATALAALVVQRERDLAYERHRTLTVHAAEAGVDSATQFLRGANTLGLNTSGGIGLRAALPCFDTTPLTGTVSAAGGDLGFSVRVRYYASDPAGTTSTWRDANAMACTVGSGPAQVPGYALIDSTATGDLGRESYGAATDRSVEAVYQFDVTNANVIGGTIRPRQLASDPVRATLCWTAASTPALAGTAVLMEPCASGSTAQQFAYRSDYTFLHIASGLCVAATYGTSNPDASLQPCDGRPQEAWSQNVFWFMQALTTDRSALAPYCLTEASTDVAGAPLALTSCPGGSSGGFYWSADPVVGAGGAGPTQQQLINLAQVRCFEVTAVNLAYPFMQANNCIQNASSPLDFWPQQVAYDPATQQFYIGRYIGGTVNSTWLWAAGGNGTVPQCITSALSNGAYITTSPCTGSSGQKWTYNRDTGNYATSYTIVDSAGLCMSIGPIPSVGYPLNSIVSATCDGTTKQKWNAPPNQVSAGTGGYTETTGQ